MKRFSCWYLIFLMLSLLLLSGCSKATILKMHDTTAKEGKSTVEPLRIAAAADLTLAFEEIRSNFEQINDVKIDIIFGSTGTLAQQIENGAPFDVFAAADIKFIDNLKHKGFIIPETQHTYARGRIGLATKTTGSVEVKELSELVNPKIKKIAIANPEHAPYGQAAKQALVKAGIWEEVKNKMVYGKNIQDTLTLINTGNADTGIIAVSLVKTDEVNFYPIKTDMYNPLNQSIAVIAATRQEALSRDFIEYVNSSEGRNVMEKYGFVLPGEVPQ